MILSTYTNGFTLKSKKKITKKEIILSCTYLNSQPCYQNVCTFELEGITEGCIIYKYNDENKNGNRKEWYKSVRLRVKSGSSQEKWYWVNENVMEDWKSSDDIIFEENKEITILLKSFHGAPLFTIEELKV